MNVNGDKTANAFAIHQHNLFLAKVAKHKKMHGLGN